MPAHDIIDNRNEKLVDHIKRILSSTERARFAVGYFFLSGLTSIAERMASVKELKLLIGNTTNRETLEQLAEGYRRLEMVVDAVEAQAYPKRIEAQGGYARHGPWALTSHAPNPVSAAFDNLIREWGVRFRWVF